MSDIESGILSQTSEPQEKPTMYFKAMLGVLSTFCLIINIICMVVATDYIMYGTFLLKMLENDCHVVIDIFCYYFNNSRFYYHMLCYKFGDERL